MRDIILDTETTGLKRGKDRIIEIGCIEVIHYKVTGRVFHQYINPLCAVEEGARRIHGISNDFLKDKPTFNKISDDFLKFIKGGRLVIHNAVFDMGFLNHEMSLLKKSSLLNEIIDTLSIARQRFPGSPASLNALCKRFNIDLSSRDLHGALLDANLLAMVYIALSNSNQSSLDFINKNSIALKENNYINNNYKKIIPSSQELTNHQVLLSKMQYSMWHKQKNIT